MILITSFIVPAEYAELFYFRKYFFAVKLFETIFEGPRRSVRPRAAGGERSAVAVGIIRSDLYGISRRRTNSEAPADNIPVSEDHGIRCTNRCVRSDSSSVREIIHCGVCRNSNKSIIRSCCIRCAGI